MIPSEPKGGQRDRQDRGHRTRISEYFFAVVVFQHKSAKEKKLSFSLFYHFAFPVFPRRSSFITRRTKGKKKNKKTEKLQKEKFKKRERERERKKRKSWPRRTIAFSLFKFVLSLDSPPSSPPLSLPATPCFSETLHSTSFSGFGFMDGYGSYGGGDRRMEIVSGKGLGACHRPYSPTQHHHPPPPQPPPPVPGREGWSGHGGGGAVAAAGAGKPWGFTDPEMKRKKRIARYKAYTVEGRVKASLRRGFQWIKNKCSQIVNGY